MCIKGPPITKVLNSSANLGKVWHVEKLIELKYQLSMCFHSQVFLLKDFLKMHNQSTYVLGYTAALTTIP